MYLSLGKVLSQCQNHLLFYCYIKINFIMIFGNVSHFNLLLYSENNTFVYLKTSGKLIFTDKYIIPK